MAQLYFRSNPCKHLSFKFLPEQEFRRIFEELSDVGAGPGLSIDDKVFAVLELVANSLRAHRERSVAKPVRVEFGIEGGVFRALVEDSGRGFNPTALPYDIDAPAAAIDPMSDSFQRYREANKFLRFGMGMISAKKAFARFELSFIDRDGLEVPWFSGKVSGTRIVLEEDIGRDADGD